MYVCTTKYPSRSSNTQKINNNSRKMFVEEERAKEECRTVGEILRVPGELLHFTPIIYNNYNKQDL